MIRPCSIVQTWANAALIDFPVALYAPRYRPRATTCSPPSMYSVAFTSKPSHSVPIRMKMDSSTACGPTNVPGYGAPSAEIHSIPGAKLPSTVGMSPRANAA